MTKVSVILPSKCFLLCVSALNLLLGYRNENLKLGRWSMIIGKGNYREQYSRTDYSDHRGH